jgi:hypothetical protein
LIFGILKKDVFVATPNVIGILAIIFQLVVYLWASGTIPACVCSPCVWIFSRFSSTEKESENTPILAKNIP